MLPRMSALHYATALLTQTALWSLLGGEARVAVAEHIEFLVHTEREKEVVVLSCPEGNAPQLHFLLTYVGRGKVGMGSTGGGVSLQSQH